MFENISKFFKYIIAKVCACFKHCTCHSDCVDSCSCDCKN